MFVGLYRLSFLQYQKGHAMMLARFWKDRRGSVAPMLANRAHPFDGCRRRRRRLHPSQRHPHRLPSRTQFDRADALENRGHEVDQPTCRTTATNTFNALFSRPDVKNVTVTATYSSTNGSHIVLNGNATINTNFLGVLGIDQIDFAATATTVWGNTRLRVALVLDNTGSMASSDKMTALKTASQNLLTQLQSAAANARRRLCFDHPVQQGRERRRQQLRRSPGCAGICGKP